MEDPKNKHKIIYYYATGSFVLLALLKFFSSEFFESAVDFSLTFLPFIIVLAAFIFGIIRAKKQPQEWDAIKRKILHETLYLLLITLLFYILYSPESFRPIMESFKKFGQLFSMENYFLFLSYASVGIISFSLVYVFVKLYQKSKGTFAGSVGAVIRRSLYTVFFVFAFLFISSFVTYPEAFSPITKSVSGMLYSIFYQDDELKRYDVENKSQHGLFNSTISKTYENLKKNIGSANSNLVETLSETKETLDSAIDRTNKDLKEKLSSDIEDRLDISGGTLAGNLTVEDNLTLEDTATTQDILPATDDTYDLGSISKGWDNAYIHALHGSSILTIGDGSTSHSMTDSNDLLVSGDLEVNGTTYLDGAISLNGAVTFAGTINAGGAVISNLADPVSAQDAVTKAYYLANTPTGVFSRVGTTISPTTSGDALNMGSGAISGGALTLSGVINATSASAHTLGSLGITAGAVTGMTSLSMTSGTLSGVSTGTISTANVTTLDLGTNTIADGDFNGAWSFNSGAVTGVSAITADEIQIGGSDNTIAATDNNGVKIFDDAGNGITIEDGGDINANNNVIKNIGNGGTDFNSSGGLTLAADLAVNGNDITSTGNLNITPASGNLVLNPTSGAVNITPSSGSNLAVTTAGAGNFVVNTSEFVVDTGVGVGIGTATPSGRLHSLESGVKTTASYAAYFNNTATNTTTDSINKYGLYVATSGAFTGVASPSVVNTNNYGIFVDIDNATGADNNYAIFSNDLVSFAYMESGAQAFPDDAGVTQWVDMAVTSSAASSTVESYSAMLDGTAALTVYGTSNGTGGLTTGPFVGIGTTTPTAMLEVKGTGTGGTIAKFTDVNTTGCTIATGGTISCSSDINLKKNIENTSYGLEALMNLRPVEFNWKSESDQFVKSIGFIAQEVENIVPKLVSTDESSGYKQLNTTGLIPILTKAIQEQQGQIESQDNILSGVALKTDTNISTLAGLQASVVEDLSTVNENLRAAQDDINKNQNDILGMQGGISALESRMASLEANTGADSLALIQTQMDLILAKYDEILLTFDAENLIYKNSVGNLDLLEGKLIAKEVATGGLVITISDSDENAPTIGTAEIAAITEDILDEDGAETPDNNADGVPDGDGIDDETRANGLNVIVETDAVTSDSKVFVTPKTATSKSLAVTEITDGSFTVSIAEPALTEEDGSLEFDWWVVGVNDESTD